MSEFASESTGDATIATAESSEISSSASTTTTTKTAAETATIAHICATPLCGKPAQMACPTCLKLGIPPSRFCDQTCFKSYWEKHKIVHKVVKNVRAAQELAASALPREFVSFPFTGPLRPFAQSPRRLVPDHIAKPDYATHPNGVSECEREDKRNNRGIRVFSPSEIERMREVCRIGREVLDIAGNAVKVGITGDEIDQIVHEACIERGAYPSPLNYYCFPKSLCTSVNEVICHGIPDKRPLADGDIVNLDISVYKDGLHSDLNETFFVGNCDENSHRLVKCAYEALGAAIALVRPGTLYR